MLRNILVVMGMICTLAVFGGCGSGGGSSTQRKATMKTVFSNYSGAVLGGIDVQIAVPAGVTVPGLDGTNSTVLSGNAPPVTLVGSWGTGTAVAGKYTPASGSQPATFEFQVLNANGFTPGQEIDVELDITSGASVKNTDFTIPYFALSHLGTFDTTEHNMVWGQDYTVSLQ